MSQAKTISNEAYEALTASGWEVFSTGVSNGSYFVPSKDGKRLDCKFDTAQEAWVYIETISKTEVLNQAKEETKFPSFPPYACVGDKIKWVVDGLLLTATIHSDDYSKPEDFEIDLPEVVQAWKNDEWFYCGIVISVEKQGIMIDENAASLWGVECNFDGRDNYYLSEVAQYLESEVVIRGKVEMQRMLQVLQS